MKYLHAVNDLCLCLLFFQHPSAVVFFSFGIQMSFGELCFLKETTYDLFFHFDQPFVFFSKFPSSLKGT